MRTDVTEAGWRDLVEHVCETLDVGPGTRVYQVACGSGAFLVPLAENGYAVGGSDPSARSISVARKAMPQGQWHVAEVTALDPAEPWDVVLTMIFDTFPSLDQARGVLARMCAKATHAVAILDVPETDEAAPAAPDSPGVLYDRAWFLRALAEIGVTAVQFEPVSIDGSVNERPCFNVYARV